MTQYIEVFDLFLHKISDVKLLSMSDDDITHKLNIWMRSAITKVKKCKSNLADRDDEIQAFNIELLDIEKEIIAVEMVAEWLNEQINDITLTKQWLGGKEEKMYSQAQHLSTLMELTKRNKLEARKLAREYSFQVYIDENLS